MRRMIEVLQSVKLLCFTGPVQGHDARSTLDDGTDRVYQNFGKKTNV